MLVNSGKILSLTICDNVPVAQLYYTYRICRSDASVISFRMCLCFNMVNFDLIIVDFTFPWLWGDNFFWLNDSETVNRLLGLDRIFK